ncbi:MAG: N-methyl-L-tryptophan oxidase [Ahniella sp.]|nr:N-methyl-L-tryptophan oxidase [Ahniella sp.]
MDTSPDILVVGLGAMGAATLLFASGQGLRVLGIDRYEPPHHHGSTHGESRITRVGVGEGAEYVPLVQRSHRLWRDLETATCTSLYHACGGLILGCGDAAPMHGQHHFLDSTVAVAEAFGIRHEVLDADTIAARWPQFQLTGAERGYFEPEAGYLRPEACVAAQLAQARLRGAEIHNGECLLEWSKDSRGIAVRTDRTTYRPGLVVFCLGAWLPGVVPAPLLRVTRQVLHWFDTERPEDYAADRFPIFIWNWGLHEGQVYYGFPDLGGGIKLATEGHVETDPNHVDRSVGQGEIEAFYRLHVRGRMRGVLPNIRRTATCLYTEAPGARFWIDRLADDGPIVVSACSGHGFKHSAAIGEAVAQWAISGVRPSVLLPFAAPPGDTASR